MIKKLSLFGFLSSILIFAIGGLLKLFGSAIPTIKTVAIVLLIIGILGTAIFGITFIAVDKIERDRQIKRLKSLYPTNGGCKCGGSCHCEDDDHTIVVDQSQEIVKTQEEEVPDRERTYVMLKPGFVKGPIIREVQNRILSLHPDVSIEEEGIIRYNRKMAERHYSTHKGKPYFEKLVSYITSEDCYGMVVSCAPGTKFQNELTDKKGLINNVRSLAGKSLKIDANGNKILPLKGTIRRDIPSMFKIKLDDCKNVIHTSDTKMAAKKEIKIFEEYLEKKNS